MCRRASMLSALNYQYFLFFKNKRKSFASSCFYAFKSIITSFYATEKLLKPEHLLLVKSKTKTLNLWEVKTCIVSLKKGQDAYAMLDLVTKIVYKEIFCKILDSLVLKYYF